MKGRDALRELIAAGKPKEAEVSAPTARSAGALKSMGLGLQHLSDEAAQAKVLRATLANSEQVVDLSPADVDVSSIADRIPTSDDPEFDSLLVKIRESGQLVPILVRPKPDDESRYEVAYGRRRLRVAAALGRPVKAIVRKLSDVELVVAQGQENGERRDLSFIERALFAAQLEERKFDRDTITAALGVDKPELSRLLGVVKAIDAQIILSIGPAPKVGRPRWLLLADKMALPKAAKAVARVVAKPEFSRLESNARFNAALCASELREWEEPPQRKTVKTLSGKRVAWLERTPTGIRLVSNMNAFASFLEHRLPDLLREFEQAELQASNHQEMEEGDTRTGT